MDPKIWKKKQISFNFFSMSFEIFVSFQLFMFFESLCLSNTYFIFVRNYTCKYVLFFI